MAATFKRTTLLLTILTAGLWALNGGRSDGLLFSLAITASTFLYHFAMRLLVGSAVNAVMKNRANVHAPWFRPRKWESKLYRRLRVKAWKRKLPTYQPELFDRNLRTPEEIVQAMCQAELVHEITVPLSFVPVFASMAVGALPVFLITSAAAAALDLSFVMLQRYNRPRLLRLLEQKNKLQPHRKNPPANA